MIRVALAGAGKMGLSHLSLLGAHPDVEVVAVCDPAKAIVGGLSQLTGFKAHSDFKSMLETEKLDAVIIATPSRFHGEMVRAALEKGLHVFCEKPFCLDLEEGKALSALAESKGLVNHVGYHYRHVGSFQESKRILDLGLLGPLHNIRAEAYGPVVLRPQGGTWRSSSTEGGGCLYDYASHALDLMNFLVGPPADVRGTILNKIFSRDVDDEVYSNFMYENGMNGQLMANWSDESFRKMSMKISIWGEKGRITADRQELQVYLRDEPEVPESGYIRGWNIKYTTELTKEVWFYLRGEEYSAQIANFVDEIKANTTGGVSTFRTALDADIVINRMKDDFAQPGQGSQRTMTPVAAAPKRGLLGSLLSSKR